MNNSYITIIKEKRTALSRKRIPLNQNGCTANFRIGVPFGQNLQLNALYDVGITMNDVNPDYVIVGEGRSYSLDTLTQAT